MRWKKHLIPVWLTLASLPPIVSACSTEESPESVDTLGGRMLRTIQDLSSEELQGRGVDTDGLDSAAVFLQREMRGMGLQPAGPEGYSQFFQVSIGVRPGEGSRLRLTGGKDASWKEPGHGWAPEGASADGQLTGVAVVLWPDGIPAAKSPRTSLPDEQAALILERESGSATASPPWRLNPRGFLWMQARRAEMLGARALLVSTDPWTTSDHGEVNLPRLNQGYTPESIPVVRMSSSWTRELLESAGVDSTSAEDHEGAVIGEVQLDLQLTMERAWRSVQNILGGIPGNGEWVLVTAHYDHLGRRATLWQGKRTYHPGADVGASGVAVLMELARRFRETPSPAGRGLIFAAFAGYEIGLAGSRHMAGHCPVPLDRIAAVVNLGSVGRLGDGPLIGIGAGGADNLTGIVHAVIERMDSPPPVVLRGSALSPGDQAPFCAKGVPCLHWTTLPHEDYHRLTDTPDKIDGEGLLRVAGFMEALVETLRTAERPRFTGALE